MAIITPPSNDRPESTPVAAIEDATGLSREVVRKWEDRYGFPQPERDVNGDRVYPSEQVQCLRLIRRLMMSGMRPGKIVGLTLPALRQLVKQRCPEPPSPLVETVLDALLAGDARYIDQFLHQQLLREGLRPFLIQTMAPLICAIGDAWLNSTIKIHDEHLFTQIAYDLLRKSIRDIGGSRFGPRIVLATASGERHTLGLSMAEAMMRLDGAECTQLGAHLPAVEIAQAAIRHNADIVALSFSAAHPHKEVLSFLAELKALLLPKVELWIGGAGACRLPASDSVLLFSDLAVIHVEIERWREQHLRL